MNDFINIDFISILESEIKIELHAGKDIAIRVRLNKDRIINAVEYFKRVELKEDIYEYAFLISKQDGQVHFEVYREGQWILCEKIMYGPFSPIGTEAKSGFYYDNNIIIQADQNSIIIEKAYTWLLWKKRLCFWTDLLLTSNISRKALFVRMLAKITQFLLKKPIYIVHDRYESSGDNGEAFWIWLRNEKKHEVNSFYVLEKFSNKYDLLSKKGSVVQKDSVKYRILLMASSCLIESAGYADLQNYSNYYRDIVAKITYVFLQHGVIYDNIACFMSRYIKRFDYVVTSSYLEKQHICNTQGYNYKENQVLLTGLPRFDFLYKDTKKQIVVMPTWRAYLSDLTDEEFATSTFYKFWKSLMKSYELETFLKNEGYQLRFKLHPAAIKFRNVFEDDEINIISEDINYNTLYAESSLIITDYSSAVSDFSYMKKPIIYIQFDKEEFFSGKHTHTKGYFDFEKDGFGPVVYSIDKAIQEIKKVINSGCILEDIYIERIENFYENIDQFNCKRLYDIIAKEKN